MTDTKIVQEKFEKYWDVIAEDYKKSTGYYPTLAHKHLVNSAFHAAYKQAEEETIRECADVCHGLSSGSDGPSDYGINLCEEAILALLEK